MSILSDMLSARSLMLGAARPARALGWRPAPPAPPVAGQAKTEPNQDGEGPADKAAP